MTMKTLEQIEHNLWDEVVKNSGEMWMPSNEERTKISKQAAQLYADEFAKAFYDWISSEDGINTIHDLQLVGELPKGIPSFDQLKPHFKASLKQKI